MGCHSTRPGSREKAGKRRRISSKTILPSIRERARPRRSGFPARRRHARARPGDIESIRIREGLGIAVGRGDQGDHGRVLGDGDARESHLLGRPPSELLHWAVVTEDLFEEAWDQRVVPAEAAHGLGVLEEREGAIPDEVRGGLVAGDQEQDGHRQHLLRAEALALGLGAAEIAHQIFARAPAAVGDHRFGNTRETPGGSGGSAPPPPR